MTLTRRRFLSLSAAAAGAGLLSACGEDRPAVRAAGAATGGPVTVRTCLYAKNHASSPLFWQRFAPAGWTVQVVPVTSAQQVQDGLEAGQLDFGLLAPYSTVVAASEGRLTSRRSRPAARRSGGLLQVRLTAGGTDHAATAASWMAKASSYSTGVSLPSRRCRRRRL